MRKTLLTFIVAVGLSLTFGLGPANALPLVNPVTVSEGGIGDGCRFIDGYPPGGSRHLKHILSIIAIYPEGIIAGAGIVAYDPHAIASRMILVELGDILGRGIGIGVQA